jgi:hypothetical protein
MKLCARPTLGRRVPTHERRQEPVRRRLVEHGRGDRFETLTRCERWIDEEPQQATSEA